jgi:uncharacterized membrane protein
VNLISDNAFRWVLTCLTGGFASAWIIVDSINIVRHRHEDSRDPLVADRKFAYWIGLSVAVVGLIGTLRFNGVM